MFVFICTYACVGLVCVGLLVYTRRYVYICMCVCVCLRTHSLQPLFSLVLESLLLRLPPWARSLKSKEPAQLLFNWCSMILLKSSCQRDMNVWLLWTGNKKTISSCVTIKTTNIIAENVISTRILLYLSLRLERRCALEHIFGICEPFVRWETRPLRKAYQYSGAEQIGGDVIGRFHCGSIRGPPWALAISGGLGWSVHTKGETELPFVKGLLCHLGLLFGGRRVIVMSRKWGIHSVPSIYCSTELALLSE